MLPSFSKLNILIEMINAPPGEAFHKTILIFALMLPFESLTD